MQGQPVAYCGVVLADSAGEGVQFRDVVCLDGGQSGVEGVCAGAVGHHLGECGDVVAEPVKLWAGSLDGGERGLLGVVEVFGAAPQPGGDVANLRRRGLDGRDSVAGILGA